MFIDSEFDSVRKLLYKEEMCLDMLPFETREVLKATFPFGYRYELATWENLKNESEEIRTRYYASSLDYLEDMRKWLREQRNFEKMGQLLLFNDELRKEVLML